MQSSHMKRDSINRLGFSKYMAKLSDSMWSSAVDLIKYMGKRGSSMAPVIGAPGVPGLRAVDVSRIELDHRFWLLLLQGFSENLSKVGSRSHVACQGRDLFLNACFSPNCTRVT